MTEREVRVRGDAGVHARPAMMFAQEAQKFSSEVYIVKGREEANAKSIMSILGLGITSGSRLIVKAEGDDEEAAVQRLVELIENDFKI